MQKDFTSSFIYYIWLKPDVVFYDIKKGSCITEFFKIKGLHLFLPAGTLQTIEHSGCN